MSRKAGCPLCKGAHITPWLASKCLFYIPICAGCGCPMAVLRDHGRDPSPAEEQRILQMLSAVADRHFKGQPWVLDRTQRSIPDHWHVHARPTE